MPTKKRKEDYELLSKFAEEKIVRFFFEKEQLSRITKEAGDKNLLLIDDDKEDDDDSCSENGTENNDSSTADSSSDTDSVESNDAREVAPIANRDPDNDKGTKYAFIRKLIRDDRRVSHQLEISNTECTNDIVRRLKRSMIIQKSNAKLDQDTASSAPLVESTAKFMKRYKDQSNALKEHKSRSTNVRLNVKKGKDVKVMVIERATPLSEVITQCRMKHNAGKKLNSLSIVSDSDKVGGKNNLRVLTDIDLLTITDGSELLLCEASASNEEAGSGEHSKKAAIVEKPEQDETKSSGKAGVSITKTSERHYWMPPDQLEDAEGSHNEEAIAPNAEISMALLNDLNALHRSNHFNSNVKDKRESLPIFQLRESMLHTIQNNQFVLVAGEPGSGKTTQLPMYILEVHYTSLLQNGNRYIILIIVIL